ncbi:hypothetical protein D3C80_2161860 [compost metagenome]
MKDGIPMIPRARIVLFRPGPKTDTSIIASNIPGKASMASMMRMMISSIQPPK